MAVAYPVLVISKLDGNLPNHMGWFHVVAGPLVCYGLVIGGMWFCSQLDLRKARIRDNELARGDETPRTLESLP